MSLSLPPAADRPPPPPGPYLVAGLGRAGAAAASAVLARGERVVVHESDARPEVLARAAELEAIGARVEIGGDGGSLLGASGAQTLVKSPGIPPDAPIVLAARGGGLTVLDELELGWRLRRESVIAITGTAGKSTVAGLIAAVLEAAGMKAPLAGNTQFGPPLTGLSDEPADAIVLEVSSFQLESCPSLLPDVAVITSFGRDHHYRHGSADAYLTAKRSLFVRDQRAAPLAVYLADQPETAAVGAEAARLGARALAFGEASTADWRVVGAQTVGRRGRVELSGPRGDLSLETRLPGVHNARNVAAAIGTATALGVSPEITSTAVEAFPGVPGRLEVVGERPLVVVDFAHNPIAVSEALPAVRELAPAGVRLVTVLAALDIYDDAMAAGIGEEAAAASDLLYATTERWRESDRREPRPALVAAARAARGASVRVVGDRRAAIAEAISVADERDAVALLGRGIRAAPLLGPGGERADASDAELAAVALEAF